MFSDAGAVKTTARRRQPRGTMKFKGPRGGQIQSQGFVRSSGTEQLTSVSIPSQIVSYRLTLSLTSSRMPSITADDGSATMTQTMLFHGQPEAIRSGTDAGVSTNSLL